MDSYTDLGVVSVLFQTAPLEAFVIYHEWYRKLAARGVSQWPLSRHGPSRPPCSKPRSVLSSTAASNGAVYGPNVPAWCVVTATLAQYDLTGKRYQVSVCDLLEQENNLLLVTGSACNETRARYSSYKASGHRFGVTTAPTGGGCPAAGGQTHLIRYG